MPPYLKWWDRARETQNWLRHVFGPFQHLEVRQLRARMEFPTCFLVFVVLVVIYIFQSYSFDLGGNYEHFIRWLFGGRVSTDLVVSCQAI
jgi:hypothetical protein